MNTSKRVRLISKIDLGARLSRVGDKYELSFWRHLQGLVPSYETFWQIHVFPLRTPGQIGLRSGLDPELETLAILNYSTFFTLGRARHKIFVKPERYKYVEEQYASLQRACELGIKLVGAFNVLVESLPGHSSKVSSAELDDFINARLNDYRNLLHDELLATLKDEQGQRFIPKYDAIDKYRKWTAVMYGADGDDFAVAESQLKKDFLATCSRLEDLWTALCAASEEIINTSEFRRRQAQGEPQYNVSNRIAASGTNLTPFR